MRSERTRSRRAAGAMVALGMVCGAALGDEVAERVAERVRGLHVDDPGAVVGVHARLDALGGIEADLGGQLRSAQFTDGYAAVWSYQRLSAACAQHGRPMSSRSGTQDAASQTELAE